jgi:3-oxoadipate enol-lactonase
MPWSERSGVSIYYESSGNIKKQTLVLIHELGGTLRSWDALAERLENDFNIVRYDQRGSGLSEKVLMPFDMAQHVDDLAGVLAEAGIHGVCMLAGVAAGAAIAVLYADKYPESCGALVLCAPALSVDPERQVYLKERAALVAQQGMRAVVAHSLARSYPERVQRQWADYETYRSMFLSNDPVSYGFANTALASANAFEVLASIQCPITFVAGQHDLLRPPEHVRLAFEQVDRARFQVIDAGHIMQVQSPDELSSIVRDSERESELSAL